MNNNSILNELKTYRDQTFSASYRNVRGREIKNSPLKFFSVFKVFERLSNKLFLEFKKRALVSEFNGTNPFKETKDKLYLAIRITGGIGDAVCIARWINQVKQCVGESVVIDVFFTSPELTRFILLSAGVRGVFSDLIFRRVSLSYDVYLIANQFITPYGFEFNYQRIVTIAPKFVAFLNNIIESQLPYQRYIDHHPRLDGLFADVVVANGLNRKDFLSVISGFDRPDSFLPIELPDIAFLEEIGLGSSKYITIHDGWDANFRISVDRPTKSFPIDGFTDTVALIKQRYPQVKIVQLGGGTGEDIAGVDVNLRGKTSFEHSSLILKQAVAHIDTESGLVHLATTLGTPCIVIYGPTNFDYYSYQENYNIRPKKCGNCMWVTDTWMESCPLQYQKPICTESITPYDILGELNKVVLVNSVGGC